LLLGIHPKDFDIATMAVPQQVKRLIYMSYIIGKRFRLVLVKRDDQQFEVATFRREIRAEDLVDPTSPVGDNFFGTPEEDARRRDFTINGLFYDPVADQLIDYVNGLPDIEARILRMIGDPNIRLCEDPIRILRGLRLAHKLRFAIEPSLREAMQKHASELLKSVLPRRREEILKILRLPEPDLAFLECFDLGILKYVIPTLHDLLSRDTHRDLFLQNLNAFQSIVTDPADTTQLFGWLIFSILQTAHEGPSERATPITIEDPIFQRLMRDELGMYKFEQSVVTKAIQLLPTLERTEDFKRRGERRQLALMKNEGFKLGLQLAVAEHRLTVEQALFWRAAHQKLAGELEKIAEEAKVKKRRRRRARKSTADLNGSGEGVTPDTDHADEVAEFAETTPDSQTESLP